ncbi:conserved Plasmodium protein, unknown function [Plasmodium ovale]|uniref:MMS19 nucleotide excision repair protein n=1 Tax=Plasmodium ovale TaxID=36330 RepID=A0A1D3U967_PLAOA|nr:conserved Plasmodium protein, unknown function [Plasmodium ovale]
MTNLETLVEEYISPERVMFRYGEEKKVELIYERNKDKEENKIRGEILRKLLKLIEPDGETSETANLKVDQPTNAEGIVSSNVCNINHSREGKKSKLKKLEEIIMALKKYFMSSEIMKRGAAVNLLAQLFEDLSPDDIDVNFFHTILLFFINKIEDWHCVNGVVKFFLVIFEKYRDILRNTQCHIEPSDMYIHLFDFKGEKEKESWSSEYRYYYGDGGYSADSSDSGDSDDNCDGGDGGDGGDGVNVVEGDGVDGGDGVDVVDGDDVDVVDGDGVDGGDGGVDVVDGDGVDGGDGGDSGDHGSDHGENDGVCNTFDNEHNDQGYPTCLTESEEEKNLYSCVVYKILKNLFKHVHAPSYLQNLRWNYYRIILISLQDFRNEIVLISNFIDKIQVQLENESDPRNIIILFEIIYTLCSEYISSRGGSDGGSDDGSDDGNDEGNEDNSREIYSKSTNRHWLFSRQREKRYLISLIDIAFYYFPIEFIKGDGRYDHVTEEELEILFFKCLKSNKRLGNYVIMNILDQFYNTEEDDDDDDENFLSNYMSSDNEDGKDKISDKQFKSIFRTLENCIPFYGYTCASKFVTTVLGIIELECIENNASDITVNYFVDILQIFIRTLNKDTTHENNSHFSKHFNDMIRNFQKYMILHRVMYTDVSSAIVDSTQGEEAKEEEAKEEEAKEEEAKEEEAKEEEAKEEEAKEEEAKEGEVKGEEVKEEEAKGEETKEEEAKEEEAKGEEAKGEETKEEEAKEEEAKEEVKEEEAKGEEAKGEETKEEEAKEEEAKEEVKEEEAKGEEAKGEETKEEEAKEEEAKEEVKEEEAKGEEAKGEETKEEEAKEEEAKGEETKEEGAKEEEAKGEETKEEGAKEEEVKGEEVKEEEVKGEEVKEEEAKGEESKGEETKEEGAKEEEATGEETKGEGAPQEGGHAVPTSEKGVKQTAEEVAPVESNHSEMTPEGKEFSFRLSEMENLSDPSEWGSDASMKSEDLTIYEKSAASEEQNVFRNENEKNILTIIREKKEIEEMKEKKEKGKKTNKIRLDKFHILEKILVCVSKGNMYTFLQILHRIISPMIRECYFLISALVNEKRRYSSGKNLKQGNGNDLPLSEEKTLDHTNVDETHQQQDVLTRNIKNRKMWDTLIMYIKIISNVIERSVDMGKISSCNICLLNEIYIIVNVLKKGKDLFFHEQHESGLLLFNILTNFLCIHNVKHVKGDIVPCCRDSPFGKEVYTKPYTSPYALFYEALFSLFYIIGFHPNPEEKCVSFFYRNYEKCNMASGENNLGNELLIEDMSYVDIWRDNIVKKLDNHMQDVKNNNENIISKKYIYKSNDLLYFLILVHKLIKYKYEDIQNYFNTFLINTCLLALKLHLCQNKHIDLYLKCICEHYPGGVPYLLFLSTNLSSFVLNSFYINVEKAKGEWLNVNNSRKGSAGSGGRNGEGHGKNTGEKVTPQITTEFTSFNEESRSFHTAISTLGIGRPSTGNISREVEAIEKVNCGEDVADKMDASNLLRELILVGGDPREFFSEETLPCGVLNVQKLLVHVGKWNYRKLLYGNFFYWERHYREKPNEEKEKEIEQQGMQGQIRIVVNEPHNNEEIALFYISFLLYMSHAHVRHAHVQAARALEASQKVSNIHAGSEKTKSNSFNDEKGIDCVTEKGDDAKLTLYDTFMSVNILEIVDLCIYYMYEEEIVRNVLLRKLGDLHVEKLQKKEYFKSIKISSDNEQMSYYGSYINSVKEFIHIEDITNVVLNEDIEDGLQNDVNGKIKNDLVGFIKRKSIISNLTSQKMEIFLYALKASIEMNVIYDKLSYNQTRKILINNNFKENLLFSRYLYCKWKNCVNHIFFFFNEKEKKEFIERLINSCLSNNILFYQNKMYNTPFQLPHQLGYPYNTTFEILPINSLLLLFIPPLLSLHTYLGRNYIYKLVKLCMYIFFFNIYKIIVVLGGRDTYEHDDNCERAFTFIKKEDSLNVCCNILKFFNERSAICFKNPFDETFNEEEIKKCLTSINNMNLNNMHACSLQIMCILLHNYADIEEIVNFIYIHFDIIEGFSLTLRDTLLFKNTIDHFTEMYKAFVHKKRNGERKEDVILSFERFLKSVFDRTIQEGETSPMGEEASVRRLFFLFDHLYFNREDSMMKTNIEMSKKSKEGELTQEEIISNRLRNNNGRRNFDIYIVDRTCLSAQRGGGKDGVEGDEVRPDGERLKRVEHITPNKHVISMINFSRIVSVNFQNLSNEGPMHEDDFYFHCHFFYSLFLLFSVFYDMTFYIMQKSDEQSGGKKMEGDEPSGEENMEGDEPSGEENMENLYRDINNVTETDTFTIFYFTYMTRIYSNICSTIYNIDTNTLFYKDNCSNISFVQNREFLHSYKTIILFFLYTLYNYFYFIYITDKHISISEFLFRLKKERLRFEYSLPFDIIRKNEQVINFVQLFVLNPERAFEESVSCEKEKGEKTLFGSRVEMDRENSSGEIALRGDEQRFAQVCLPESVTSIGDSSACNSGITGQMVKNYPGVYGDYDNCRGYGFPRGYSCDRDSPLSIDSLKKRKKEKLNKYNCKYLSIIHLMSILLLNMPFEETINYYYNILEICLLKGINKVANFFINRSYYKYNNRYYINEVLRKNTNIIKKVFYDVEDDEKEVNEQNRDKSRYKQLLVKEIVSLNMALCLRLLYLIVNLLNYFQKLESKINEKEEIGNSKNCTIKENFHFLLSYKNIIIKSIMKILVSVPLPLIRYLCACIFYTLSFFTYQSFLPNALIQDIKWFLSIASIDPHKKVRRMVTLCIARWM